MGMDVFGMNPTTTSGTYFRNNLWWWTPLWNYVSDLAEDIISDECFARGHCNDGANLNDIDCIALADRLKDELDSGNTAEYEKEFIASKENNDKWDLPYGFSVENVREFEDFLRHCGGFEIW